MSSLSAGQLKAVAAMAAGESKTDAAKSARVSRATLHRWLTSNDEFLAALNRARQDLQDTLVDRLHAAAERAVGCVADAIDDGDARTALAVLKGLGMLPGAPRSIGSTVPEELASSRREMESLQQLLTFPTSPAGNASRTATG